MSKKFSNHYDLDVWKKSLNLVTDIYKITSDFPKEEKFGLGSHLRKTAISIPSNIAEGAARKGNKEFIRFLYISLGSLSELDTQLLISENLEYLNYNHDLKEKVLAIKYMLNGLINSLTSNDK